jgi:hypothetical protein
MIEFSEVFQKLSTEWNEVPSVFYFKSVDYNFVVEYLEKSEKVFEISEFIGFEKEINEVLLSIKSTYNIFIKRNKEQNNFDIYYITPRSKVDEVLFHINYKLRKKK